MLMTNFARISNKYDAAITQVLANENESQRIYGEFNFDAFKASVSQLLKNMYVEVIIVDHTSFASDQDLLESLRYLKSCNSKVRIIVIYPNLSDKIVASQIYAFGIYDIVMTKIDEEVQDEFEVEKLIITDLKWNIQEPVQFANVANDLSITKITQNIIKDIEKNAVEAEPKAKKVEPKKIKSVMKKNRVLVVATEEKFLDTIAKVKDFTVVEAIDYKSVATFNISTIDTILCHNALHSNLTDIVDVVSVSNNSVKVLCAYDDYDLYQKSLSVADVSSFFFEDDFMKSYKRAYHKKYNVDETQHGKAIAFIGAKGGVGTTTMALLSARDIAKNNPSARVCVVDFSINSGDVAEKSGIASPAPNLFLFIQSILKAKENHVDIALLKSKVKDFCHFDSKNKLYVLPTASKDVFSFVDPTKEGVVESISYIYEFTLQALLSSFDIVVLDVKGDAFNKDIAILKANEIVLVANSKLSATNHLIAMYNTLLALNKTNISVVMNSDQSKSRSLQFENLKTIKSIVPNEALFVVPFDKKIDKEEVEMTIRPTSKTCAVLNELNNKIFFKGVKRAKKGWFK